MRSEQERSQLRSIVQSPQWKTVIAVAEELCVNVKTEQIPYDTEWETLRETLINEGQSRGIKRLLQSVEREAFQDTAAQRDESFGDQTTVR